MTQAPTKWLRILSAWAAAASLLAAHAAASADSAGADSRAPGPGQNPPAQSHWSEVLFPLQWPLSHYEMSHLLPHLLPTVLVYGTLGIATTVLFEATLSFLGVGVQPPTPSWGKMIFDSQSYYLTAPWLVFIPGAAILIVALAFNLVGDGLRDALDPTQRGRR